jgi:hypothetical protein
MILVFIVAFFFSYNYYGLVKQATYKDDLDSLIKPENEKVAQVAEESGKKHFLHAERIYKQIFIAQKKTAFSDSLSIE